MEIILGNIIGSLKDVFIFEKGLSLIILSKTK
jgi:hypothetical protein